MEPFAYRYWLPKRGNTLEEYEDASAMAGMTHAIADGATESSFADRWAQMLVNAFIQDPGLLSDSSPEFLGNWLAPLQKQWHSLIAWDKLPWYAEEKARAGAFAALCGVRFQQPEAARAAPTPFWRRWLGLGRLESARPGRWSALAAGDSCLFQVRNNTLLKAFPISRSDDFSPRPILLSSNPEQNGSAIKGVAFASGDYRFDDLFILATDALGCWFMKQHEAGEKRWKTLLAIKAQAGFEHFIEHCRDTGAIKNDDTTLLILSWDPRRRDPPPSPS